jgi:hypothetical protein
MIERHNYSQARFIPAANQKINQFGVHPFDEGGICDALVNTYIKYASNDKTNLFFELLTVKDHEFSIIDAFILMIKREERNKMAWLGDRICHSAFTFLATNHRELEHHVNLIIKKIKTSSHKDCFLKMTLGHVHCVVLEQQFVNDKFIYYLYDPNNPEKPKPLSSSEEITKEIECSVKRIAFSTNPLKYYLDSNYIINCYLYSKSLVNDQPMCLKKIKQRLDSFDSKSAPPELKDANYYLQRLSIMSAATGVVINNLDFLFSSLRPDIKSELAAEIKALKCEKENYLLSTQFLPTEIKKINSKCFSYIQHSGNVTLLHEMAYVGDLEAIQKIISYADHFAKDNYSILPVQYAINSSEYPAFKLLIKHAEKQDEKTISTQSKKLDYLALSSSATTISSSSTYWTREEKDMVELDLWFSNDLITNYIWGHPQYKRQSRQEDSPPSKTQQYSFFSTNKKSIETTIKLLIATFALYGLYFLLSPRDQLNNGVFRLN